MQTIAMKYPGKRTNGPILIKRKGAKRTLEKSQPTTNKKYGFFEMFRILKLIR